MKTTLTAILILSLFQTVAQIPDTTFQKVFYSVMGPYMARTIAGTADDGAIILGDYNFTGSSLTRIDSAGTQLWTKNYTSTDVLQSSNLQFRDMTKTHDSCLVSVGYASQEGTTVTHLIIVKTNMSGDTLWTARFNKTSHVPLIGTAVHEGVDSSLLVCGYGLENNKAYVMKLDSLGNLLWDQELSDAGSMEPYGITQTTNGNIYIVGNRYTGIPAQQGFIVTLDSDGNYIAAQGITDANAMDVIDHNGEVYVLGAWGNYISVFKFDYSNNVLFKRSYYYTTPLDYSRKSYLRILSNGNLAIMYGDRWFTTELMILDTNGDIMQQQSILWGGSDVLETQKKGLFMIGYGPLYGVKMLNHDHTGVVRTDSLYSLFQCSWESSYIPYDADVLFTSLNITSTPSLVKSPLVLFISDNSLNQQPGCVEIWGGLNENGSYRLQASPNPTSDLINFQQPDGIPFQLLVTDLNGKVVFNEVSYSEEKQINMAAFERGIYIYHVQFENGKAGNGKIVLE